MKNKTSEEQLSQVEMGSLPKKELKIMIVKMIQELRKRMTAQSKQLQGVLNKELENVNSNQTE